MPLSKGDKLGPYKILVPIGKGAMGEAYRAHDVAARHSGCRPLRVVMTRRSSVIAQKAKEGKG
jgi:hypothetical protein